MAEENNTSAKKIGEAWGLHRNNQNEEAAAAFRELTQVDEHSVDAYYGLGLSLRAMGQREDAVEAFRRAYNLAKEKLEALRAEIAEQQGETVTNSLQMTEDDRFMMLVRMLHQRLAEEGVDVPAIVKTF